MTQSDQSDSTVELRMQRVDYDFLIEKVGNWMGKPVPGDTEAEKLAYALGSIMAILPKLSA